MGTFRTPETEAKYQAQKDSGVMKDKCPLCDERTTLKDYTHWRIVENLFPYDRFAKVHHMLISKRHAPDKDLTEEEWEEYRLIKSSSLQETYEFFIEPTLKQKSIPAHSHFHMVISKFS